jgi:type II secretory pathway component PulF
MVIRGIGAFAAFVLLCLILWPSLLGILFLPILLYYIGWFPRDLPVVWRFFKRYDGALVMRGLALSIRRGLPLPQALTLLRDEYPLRHVSRQLGKALERVQQGQDWCASLRQTGLIGRADAAVLAAAQRVGNLQWALEEMADSALRRQAQWILAATQVLYPIALLVLASFVFFFVVGMFAPLVSLIQGLT